jgi:hypothetical protein
MHQDVSRDVQDAPQMHLRCITGCIGMFIHLKIVLGCLRVHLGTSRLGP